MFSEYIESIFKNFATKYKFLISDEYIELEIQKRDGEVYIYEIEKDFDEELGIEFVNPIIDK